MQYTTDKDGDGWKVGTVKNVKDEENKRTPRGLGAEIFTKVMKVLTHDPHFKVMQEHIYYLLRGWW